MTTFWKPFAYCMYLKQLTGLPRLFRSSSPRHLLSVISGKLKSTWGFYSTLDQVIDTEGNMWWRNNGRFLRCLATNADRNYLWSQLRQVL